MATCSRCQRANPEDAAFCSGCGTPLERRCPACQRANAADAAFCNGCGERLEEAAPDVGSPSRVEREPRDYTPKHLADKILQSKSALEGERKQVTVLFADVKGSMELQEGIGPEEWHGIMDRFFQILTEGVHRYEGTVNQYTGDGIMALFGAPIAHEDHAQRACYAALHLRDALRSHGEEVKRRHGVAVGFRLGLNSGEVVVGKIGDDLRMDYTAQGFTTGLADRMQKLADPGTVYLSDRTQRLVEGYFRVRDLDEFELKGVSEPIRVYELEEVGAFHSRFDVSRARGLSKFVGRDREMALLEAALERARGGRGQIVGIVSEAGTGKSRLAYQFVERCRELGVSVVTDSCPPYGKTLPLRQIMSLTRSQFGITDEDDAEATRNKIAASLSRLDPALAEHIPFMMDFLGVAEPGQELPPMSPEARQREFLRYFSQATGSVGLTVVLKDDQQWVDPASEAVNVETTRLHQKGHARLSLMTFRPEYRPPEADWPNYEEIRLKPLTAESTAELLADLLGPQAAGQGLEERIQEHAAGNPFFVEEVMQSLAESGFLEGNRGAYRLVKPVETIEVPDSVQAVLAARIDRLGEGEKSILHAASVIGKELPESILESVADLPTEELSAGLFKLRSSDFLYELSLFPETVHAFKHPLTQAVAYESQLTARRREVHARVAQALEQRHADKLDEKAALIAYHWESAGDAQNAASWYARGARWLGANNAREALHAWNKVRELLNQVERTPEADRLRIAACGRALDWGVRLGISSSDADAIFEEGCAVAKELGEPRLLSRLKVSYGTAKARTGDLQTNAQQSREAVALADESNDKLWQLGSRINLAFACLLLGELREASQIVDEVLARFDSARLDRPSAPASVLYMMALRCRAHLDLAFGRPLSDAEQGYQTLLSLAQRAGSKEEEFEALAGLSSVALERGDADAAVENATHGVTVADRLQSPRFLSVSLCQLGRALCFNADWAAASRALEEALRIVRDEFGGGAGSEAGIVTALAEVHLGRGDIDQARELAAEAASIAHGQKHPMAESTAELLKGRIALSSEGPEAIALAESALQRASTLLERAGAAMARLHEAWAELSGARQHGPEQGQHLREAHRLYTEMGATGHAQRVARELSPAS